MIYALIRADGTVVKSGEKIIDFRGNDYVFIQISKNPEPPSGGRIEVQVPGSPYNRSEYYPSVFDCVIEGRSDG